MLKNRIKIVIFAGEKTGLELGNKNKVSPPHINWDKMVLESKGKIKEENKILN